MTDNINHRFTPERTNHGAYFSDCSCGWSGGVYPSRGDAKHAHAAHVTGRPVPEPIRPMLLGLTGRTDHA